MKSNENIMKHNGTLVDKPVMMSSFVKLIKK